MTDVSSARSDDRDAGTPAAVVLLADGVRRRIFRFVRRARRPVTRDEVAASAGVSRNLAAFHLDKLVEAGLLRAGTQASASPARVGRRSKVYEPGPVEVHVDVPMRQHALLAGVLVDALAAAPDDAGVRRAAAEAARDRGARIGEDARAALGDRPGPAGIRALLERLGFEPYEDGRDVLRLGNCPFHPLAAGSPELVCGLNVELIRGLIAGVESETAKAILAPLAGECCVEIRFDPAGRAP